MAKKVDTALLTVSVGGFFLMSASFLLMRRTDLGFLPGILFWAGMLVGIVTQLILETHRRILFSRYRVSWNKMQKPRNGLLSFFSNPAAKIADIGLAVSLLATVIVFVATHGLGYGCYICISATVFMFCIHCVLNGRIFIYVRQYEIIRHMLEETYASTKKKERKL